MSRNLEKIDSLEQGKGEGKEQQAQKQFDEDVDTACRASLLEAWRHAREGQEWDSQKEVVTGSRNMACGPETSACSSQTSIQEGAWEV